MARLKSLLTGLKVKSARFAVAATVAATGIAFVTQAGSAYAIQLCASGGVTCLNAWGGGPEVNVFSPGAANNQFTVTPNGNYDWLKFNGSGSYHGACISDFNGLQDNARAGLVSCGGSAGTPWGANFDSIPCTSGSGHSGIIYNNVHWGQFLGPRTANNGEPFYLNKPSGWCFWLL
ncbi:MAG TPA: hypothetical protein VLG47_04680 [Candidatus Saccharimonadales bacterium]|nr:hypothetical protein [Candidatus Saccharimonadales bacterium]